MKTILSKAVVFAAVITIMMQCAPLLSGMMTSMFGQYEVLADSIVIKDDVGNIELNGQSADTILTNLGSKSQVFTATIKEKAQEVLNTAETETEITKENKPNFEELKIKAKELLSEINIFFK